jgi:hypothetical protein
MRATNRKNMQTDEFLLLTMRLIQKVRNMPRANVLFLSFLGLALLTVCLSGCAPSSSPNDSSASGSNELPELTDDVVRERINDAFVRDVPEENGAADPISWNFEENEPKEIAVVEKKVEGTRATIVLDIKTGSAPNMRNPRRLEGQIRTEWQLKTGWALRKWEIVGTENISMKYRNLQKPPAQNSSREGF